MTPRKFGTFEGVFTPCLLSILGVIMYLRLGWVVGKVGLFGTLVIICLANMISLITVLSMSSIVSNIRIGAGGAYSVITKSLGIEAGGAIGIPLYISQAISIAFYIAGFSECWSMVFPDHNPLMVSLIVWLILLTVSYVGVRFAFRIQYLIMALIVCSLISISLGKGNFQYGYHLGDVNIFNNFWAVFAVFFPAVTGILAGASMSGELKDPKKSIPLGTVFAVGLSFFVYISLALWFANNASAAELVNNSSVIIKLSRFKWMVIAGIMGATISSGLSMFVGSPRILMALGKHSIFPLSSVFSKLNKKGEPALAILFTALITLITILFGTLNEIASLLTMFFLITYGIINLTVFIEQSIGIPSFRPTFRFSKLISFLGGILCFVVMFFINAKFSLFAILTIFLIYLLLVKREAQIYSPDIRSGMLVFLAEQFAKSANQLPYYPKIWKPNVLIPIQKMESLNYLSGFIHALAYPSGRVTLFHIVKKDEYKDIEAKESQEEALKFRVSTLKDEGIFMETTIVESDNLYTGSLAVMQTLKGMMFPPNTLLYPLDPQTDHGNSVERFIEKASLEGLGVIVLNYFQKTGFNKEEILNLWVRKQSPNIDLSVLITLQLQRNWGARVRIVQVVDSEEEVNEAKNYLMKLKELMRMPGEFEIVVLVGQFNEVIKRAPFADINIFGMQENPDLGMILDVSNTIQSSVLFLRDSKHESALA